MRATIMFGAGDVRIENVPDAQLIEPTDALVRVHVGFFGYSEGIGGAQAEAVRIPFADGTLFVLPVGQDEALMPALLTLSDVMGTGRHAAVGVKVRRGKKVAVIGDGAVGLRGVIAAKRLGAEQIILLGRHPDRIALAKAFGATDVVSERGEEAVERVKALSGGPAPVRAYIDELLPDVLEGRIEPGRVFDRVIGLEEVPDGYRAMNEREAIKVMVKP